jgi:RNA polymerase sigma-70 factor (ECF subfamily)
VSEGDAAPAADVELVRRAQAGDEAAFGELVDRTRRAVFRTALAAVRSPAEAEDVAQEAFVAAFRHISRFRGDSSFKTWILTIAWRKARDRRRRIRRWLPNATKAAPVEEAGGNEIERLPAAVTSHEEQLAHAELLRHVRRLIGALPGRLRDPLLLAGSGEHSYDEIARLLGVPVGTAKWRVSEARRLLKKKLAAAQRRPDDRT